MNEEQDIAIRDIPDRKWGIELEIARGMQEHREELAHITKEALYDSGLHTSRVVVTSTYCHDGPYNTVWKWKSDGSCGGELTSPVLSGWRGLHELQIVMDRIDKYANDNDYKLISRDTGVHVHVDCRDYLANDVKNLVMSMKMWEPIFYAMNPYSRVGNRYCISMNVPMKKFMETTSIDAIRDVWDSPTHYGDRHHALNLAPLWKRGSIEFRYFAGTWAFEKAAAAVLMSLLTAHAVKIKGRIRIPKQHMEKSYTQVWELLWSIGFEKFIDKFFRDFLVIRTGKCPTLGEFIKYIKRRIMMFYKEDGSRRQNGA